jgi:phosphonate ABC transporter permease subunit PhnE
MEDERSRQRPFWHYLLIGLAAFLVYAYGVQAVNIDLRVPQEPRRQANLINMLRQMARPDFFTYEFQTERNNLSFRTPCPEQLRASQITYEGRTVTLAPNCADTTQEVLTLSGEGFPAHARGVMRWHPPGETAVARHVTNFRANEAGRFTVNFTMPDVRPSEEVQRMEIEEVLGSQISGFSEASRLTWNRILETVLMALMASTIATIVAIPLSFIAARNLMAAARAPLAGIMTAIAAIPVGVLLATLVAEPLQRAAAALVQEAALMGLVGLVVVVGLVWPTLRLGPPLLTDGDQTLRLRAISLTRIGAAVLLILFALLLTVHLGLIFGRWLAPQLGPLGFFGTFIRVMSDVVRVMFSAFLGLVAIFMAISMGSHYGQEAVLRLPVKQARIFTGVVTALGTAVLIYGVGSAMNWFYQFENPQNWTLWPALVGGLIFGLASLAAAPKRQFPLGITVYAMTRGVLNLLRAIEPLILGTIFVVWVGLGPFAGIMALTLNSIADLGKLFSEEVENINQGPIEAVTATGANRLQTIVFAVIPQIVPPFIAFAFYRWDINVRLSTIIGFVGGGGVGVILLRYTNLLQYRQAAVVILAIAIVVGLLDYVSSELRKRLL